VEEGHGKLPSTYPWRRLLGRREIACTPEQMGFGSELGGDEEAKVERLRRVGASQHGCQRRGRLEVGEIGSKRC
jgi:hypothetical protein